MPGEDRDPVLPHSLEQLVDESRRFDTVLRTVAIKPLLQPGVHAHIELGALCHEHNVYTSQQNCIYFMSTECQATGRFLAGLRIFAFLLANARYSPGVSTGFTALTASGNCLDDGQRAATG